MNGAAPDGRSAAMTITKIERQKKARHRVSIHLDGEFAFGADEELVYVFRLAPGRVLDESTIARIREEDLFRQARAAAMRFLARRMHSVREMEEKLRERQFPEHSIGRVTARLLSLSLLDDREYARAFVRDRMRFRPAAKANLFLQLRKRGVPEEEADAALCEYFTDEVEETMARAMADKWLARHAGLAADVRKRRLAGYLSRRGYRASLIHSILEGVE